MCISCRGMRSPVWGARTGRDSRGDSSPASTLSSKSMPTSHTILRHCQGCWRRSRRASTSRSAPATSRAGPSRTGRGTGTCCRVGATSMPRRVLGLGVADSTAGYRAYSARILRKLDLERIRAEGYGFQIEMTYRAKDHGAAITEVPISFVDRAAGESKMSSFIVVEALGLVTWWGLGRLVRGLRRALSGGARSHGWSERRAGGWWRCALRWSEFGGRRRERAPGRFDGTERPVRSA